LKELHNKIFNEAEMVNMACLMRLKRNLKMNVTAYTFFNQRASNIISEAQTYALENEFPFFQSARASADRHIPKK
jgi:hypothetical protein